MRKRSAPAAGSWRCRPYPHLPLLIILLLGVGCGIAAAQESVPTASSYPTEGATAAATSRPTTHATLFGIGGVHQLDTYLSPLNYHGTQVQFLHETLRPTHWQEISFQSIWQADLSTAQNEAGKQNLMGGNMSYDVGWHYNWHPTTRLRLMAGPQIGGNIGFLYHSRNSNNPAQALASLRLSGSAAAIYTFRIWQKPFAARYQLDVPLAGLMFSPDYGQSYYEVFELGHQEHNLRFTSPFNAPSLRHQLTLDFPLGRRTIRVGYLGDIRQSHVNDIKHHHYSHAFVIGWVRHFNYRKHTEASSEGFIM